LQNDDNGRFVIPGKRSATRNPLFLLDSRFRGNDGGLILYHFARSSSDILLSNGMTARPGGHGIRIPSPTPGKQGHLE
jgi:hypothetical protein